MTFADSGWLHGMLTLLKTKVVSQAWRGNLYYSRGSVTQMLTESQPSAWRWPPVCAQTSKKCHGGAESHCAIRCQVFHNKGQGHMWTYTAEHTHNGSIAHSHSDCSSSLTFVPSLHTSYHTKHNDCRLVINELLNLSEPVGDIAERVRV